MSEVEVASAAVFRVIVDVWTPLSTCAEGWAVEGETLNGEGAVYVVWAMKLTRGAEAGETSPSPSAPRSKVTVRPFISEFRLSGPSGANDEYVELYNNTDSDFTVAASDSSGGWALAISDNSIPTPNPVVIFTIPDGATIPARGHYLAVTDPILSNPYSLTPDGDLHYTTPIPDSSAGDPRGMALFTTSNVTQILSATPLDAVGYDGVAAPYFEGTGLSAGEETTQNLQYAWVRDLSDGEPKDTGNNASDFLKVDVAQTGSLTLGAPGPENTSSPITHNESAYLQVANLGLGGRAAPVNRYRDVNPNPLIPNNADDGTLTLQRTITNTSGHPLSALKLRIATLTTAPQDPAGPTADLRLLGVRVNDSDDPSNPSDPQKGAGLAPDAPTPDPEGGSGKGGGVNSSVTVVGFGLAHPTLGPGETITISMVFGVMKPGVFKILVNLEAQPLTIP